ncbi:hypothetical protein TRVL_03959 [Trypanosoma vivax]|nr:hypothetical protein TRVL_03959 [Trypanosoma vivax]
MDVFVTTDDLQGAPSAGHTAVFPDLSNRLQFRGCGRGHVDKSYSLSHDRQNDGLDTPVHQELRSFAIPFSAMYATTAEKISNYITSPLTVWTEKSRLHPFGV